MEIASANSSLAIVVGQRKVHLDKSITLKNMLHARIKISVNTDISIIGFYGYIKYIGKISVDIFT